MKNEAIEAKIKALLAKMTAEEKIGQLRQCGPSLVGAFEVSFEELLNMMFDGRISQEEFGRLMSTAKQDFREEDLRAGKIGSYNGIGDAATANRLQKIAVEETRLGIPLIIGYDVIHGYRTTTPIPLAESCAFDPELWEETAAMAAKEASASGIHMTFAPMVDVAKDARWGRVSEGAGEDVLMNAQYGAAKVRGFQGTDLKNPTKVAACVKHFAAYGAIEAGRDYNRVDMSEQKLFEEYLPSYKACVEAGARAIMPAFNDINGTPCSVNDWLLDDILRKEWGFDGMTVSDANAIAECVNHGIAEDRLDAAAKALNAGMDMDMTSDCYNECLMEALDKGLVSEEALDRAVADILRVKFEMDLFEHPYRGSEEREKAEQLSEEHRAIALKAALESAVLLKNADGLLPLAKDTKIFLAGELADLGDEMTGAWSIGAPGGSCVSVRDGLTKAGAVLTDLAEEADVIIAVLGERKDMSGEAASRADITLPEAEMNLFRELKETGKPVAVILFNGRPLAIPELAEKADAVLEGWHLGAEAGTAIAKLVYGETVPSGKLTTTFPFTSGQCPMYYAHINTGRPGGKAKFTSKYLDTPLEPVYSFGYGLSYTTFTYQDLAVTKQQDAFRVRVTLTNTGDREGTEIAQCYVQDVAASRRVRPVRSLKGFSRMTLAAGESREVSFTIPFADLGYYDREMNYIVEPGAFRFYVGGSSVDTLCAAADL